ncbi:dysbindin isoform X2 [Falco biarmicus]|uniref:dysbindin isoform X2 n=1 Tax=Falco rusticolus TaxID=120794 RepID=UPI0018868C85|nr:dysbindin isoform X2 [Falco rusticolus]XP_055560432.1 dysbindin isoform X2 [Falco cherrug]XP_055655208.1 dysbindin isoform X2 [Falco peregrinus]XP_056187013.1 dysbindin isoform X2 [Falco biarmicus]
MLETLRERLLSVQQDLTAGLKTLGDKSREAKKSRQRTVQCLPEFSAGLELLSRYEDAWAALHKGAKDCAKAGELVDSEVVMLSAHWEKKRNSLVELQDQLQQIPGFLADLECLTASLAELDAEHAQKVLDMEHTQQMKLKERQKFFEEAFQQDMEQYLSTGYLQIAERREPIGSMSSMEVNVDMLEQMDLMDMSDQEALDVFLNSGGEDNNMLSPMLGPDSHSYVNEISLQVPSQSELRQKLSSLSSTCTDSASQDASEGESPVVQSDEEEVQVDTALAAVTERKGASDVSDESDSQTI